MTPVTDLKTTIAGQTVADLSHFNALAVSGDGTFFAVRDDDRSDRRIRRGSAAPALGEAERPAHQNGVSVVHVVTIPVGNRPLFRGFSAFQAPSSALPRRSIAYTLPGRFFEKLFISVATSTSSR